METRTLLHLQQLFFTHERIDFCEETDVGHKRNPTSFWRLCLLTDVVMSWNSPYVLRPVLKEALGRRAISLPFLSASARSYQRSLTISSSISFHISSYVYSCLFFFLTGLHFFHLLFGLFLCCLSVVGGSRINSVSTFTFNL